MRARLTDILHRPTDLAKVSPKSTQHTLISAISCAYPCGPSTTPCKSTNPFRTNICAPSQLFPFMRPFPRGDRASPWRDRLDCGYPKRPALCPHSPSRIPFTPPPPINSNSFGISSKSTPQIRRILLHLAESRNSSKHREAPRNFSNRSRSACPFPNSAYQIPRFAFPEYRKQWKLSENPRSQHTPPLATPR